MHYTYCEITMLGEVVACPVILEWMLLPHNDGIFKQLTRSIN